MIKSQHARVKKERYHSCSVRQCNDLALTDIPSHLFRMALYNKRIYKVFIFYDREGFNESIKYDLYAQIKISTV